MSASKPLIVTVSLGVLACFNSVLFGQQCGSVTSVDGAVQTLSGCPQIEKSRTVFSHCYYDNGSVAATPSDQLHGFGECDNNRSYSIIGEGDHICDLDLSCPPSFAASFSVWVLPDGYHGSMAYSQSRAVNWTHGATGVSPSDCLQNGCRDTVQNSVIVPCPDMCEGADDEEEGDEDGDGDCGECLESPLVLDFGKVGFRFSSLENGIEFDIDGDGTPEWISWTTQDSEDAFLALDRNHNGIIDDGTELFGDATVQPDFDSPNGFAALSVFDDPAFGGNGDGRISGSDAVFSELWLWVDWSHDGYSDAAEMIRLSESTVLWIDLDYRTSRRRDRHGNELRYISRYFDRNSKRRWVTDVFFVTGEN